MSDYVIKRLTSDRILDLYILFKASLKRGANLEKFKKKYNTEYTGKSYIGYLAYDDLGFPAAFYGVIPYLANYNKENVLIAQSADTITHPNHQRKGLFIKLAIKTYDLAKEEGIQFLFGIPNELSYPGFIKKLNWIHLRDMIIYEEKVPMLPLSYFFRMNQVLSIIYNYWVGAVFLFMNKGTINIINSNVSTSTNGIIRNDEYYRYKNYTKKYSISINGKTIWLKIDGALKVGDIEKCSQKELSNILGKLKIIAFLLGIKKIQFQFSSNSRNIEVFDNIIIRGKGLPIIILDFTGKYDCESLVLSLADIDTF